MTSTTTQPVARLDWHAAAGVAGIGLLFIALFLPGPPPRSSESVADLTRVLVDKRGVLLAGMWIAGLGGAAFLWFLGALHDHLRRHDAEREATVAVAGGIVAVVLIWTGMSMSSALALGLTHARDDALIRAGTDLGNILIELSKFGLAVLIAVTALAGRRRSSMPRWAVRCGIAASVVVVASVLPPFLADHGFWQFGGPPEIAGGLPAAIWLLWVSVRLTRSGREPIAATDGRPRHGQLA